jgi:hypothetical protein
MVAHGIPRIAVAAQKAGDAIGPGRQFSMENLETQLLGGAYLAGRTRQTDL